MLTGPGQTQTSTAKPGLIMQIDKPHVHDYIAQYEKHGA